MRACAQGGCGGGKRPNDPPVPDLLSKNDKTFANGGRVLNFISLSDELVNARSNIHSNLDKLDWKKGFYRRDIAFKVIDK